jgi:hypothetical protein
MSQTPLAIVTGLVGADGVAIEQPEKHFNAPEAPAADATFFTVHGHMAEVMRRIVAIDDASFQELALAGAILPAETREATECMRGAVAMYELAAAAAAAAPVAVMIQQAIAKIDAANAVAADDDPEIRSNHLTVGRSLLSTALLAMDFQPPIPDPAAG